MLRIRPGCSSKQATSNKRTREPTDARLLEFPAPIITRQITWATQPAPAVFSAIIHASARPTLLQKRQLLLVFSSSLPLLSLLLLLGRRCTHACTRAYTHVREYSHVYRVGVCVRLLVTTRGHEVESVRIPWRTWQTRCRRRLARLATPSIKVARYKPRFRRRRSWDQFALPSSSFFVFSFSLFPSAPFFGHDTMIRGRALAWRTGGGRHAIAKIR